MKQKAREVSMIEHHHARASQHNCSLKARVAGHYQVERIRMMDKGTQTEVMTPSNTGVNPPSI